MKKIFIIAGALFLLFFVVLDTSLIGDEALAWVAAHPKDPNSPEVLYDAGRWCDWMGNDGKASALYLQLVKQYPQQGDLCAPALYHVAYNLANGTYILGIKKQALPYLDTILNQYSDKGEWAAKAKELSDEVNRAH